MRFESALEAGWQDAGAQIKPIEISKHIQRQLNSCKDVLLEVEGVSAAIITQNQRFQSTLLSSEKPTNCPINLAHFNLQVFYETRSS